MASSTDERIRDIDERLRKVEEGQAVMKQEQIDTHQLAMSIKADTAEMVSLFKGSKVLGQMIKWAVYVTAAGYAFFKYVKGGN